MPAPDRDDDLKCTITAFLLPEWDMGLLALKKRLLSEKHYADS
jgi:hypothetical protein